MIEILKASFLTTNDELWCDGSAITDREFYIHISMITFAIALFGLIVHLF